MRKASVLRRPIALPLTRTPQLPLRWPGLPARP